MTEYSFNSSNFQSSVKFTATYDLGEQIENLNLTSATYQRIDTNGVPPDITVNIYFSGPLSDADQTTLTNFLLTYNDPQTQSNFCNVLDQESPGTNGGDFVQDIWTTRVLNTLIGTVSYITLANNQMTIAPGEYVFNIKAPCCNVQSNQIRLRNITNTTYTLGSSSYASGDIITTSSITACLLLTQPTVFDVQHICSNTILGTGLGKATGYGVEEVYTTVFIQKIS
jgi:hypothetical protein